jgi:membrane protease YdiL (CAAX protease family)
MVLVTSLGFAAVHGGLSFPKQVSVAVIGMWWGLSYLAAGRNLLVPITAHAYQNLMNLLKWLV